MHDPSHGQPEVRKQAPQHPPLRIRAVDGLFHLRLLLAHRLPLWLGLSAIRRVIICRVPGLVVNWGWQA